MAAFGALEVGKMHHVTRTCRQYLYHPAEIRREANVWPFTRALIDVGARTKKRGCKKSSVPCIYHPRGDRQVWQKVTLPKTPSNNLAEEF